METFQKEISFLSKVHDGEKWNSSEVVKTATFKELDRTDKLQHKLHFKIIAIFETFGVKKEEDPESAKIKIDSDGMYDLTVKAISTLLLPDQEFTVQDKTEFLNDSAAIMNFGFWLMAEKITPFFLTFRLK